ncbi:MAG: tetratricopeptide repeat protein [Planctomycetaceae bacterium]|nr:tetratricopeptide repeat protein [Planctomycetaceae bacterium]
MSLGEGVSNTENSGTLLRFIRQGKSFSGHEANCCFLNTGSEQFADISAAAHLNWEDDGRAIGRVDWDQDGDLDLWVINRNGPQIRYLQNGLHSSNRFVAFRLEGTTCNRDGIGAKVEIQCVEARAPSMIRNLSAGDGYLAQSSKWLHFGLGKDAQIKQVLVHWPDGTTDQYSDVSPNRHYLLRQGESKASIVSVHPISLPQGMDSPDSLSEATEASDQASVRTLSRLPVPRLPYRTSSSEAADVFQPGSGQAVLLNLWASWCKPCLIELEELSRNQQLFANVGLDVVALNVDSLNPATASREPGELLAAIDFPFRSGTADARLIEKLQLLNNHMFDLHLPLPIPTSALIDGQGRLLAWYRGPVSVDRILTDLQSLEWDQDQLRSKNALFAGKWLEPQLQMPLIPILDGLISAGFLLEADDYVRRLQHIPKRQLLPAIVRLGTAFYHRGGHQKAQEHFRVAVRIDPNFDGVETALGQIREQEGRPDSAIKLYELALKRNPTSLRAINNLAWLLATHPAPAYRDGQRAVELAKQSVELTDRNDSDFLDTLAAAYAEQGNFDKALQVSTRALAICLERGQSSLAKKIKARRELYQQSKPFHRSP